MCPMSPQRRPRTRARSAAAALLLAVPLAACGGGEDPQPAGPRPELVQPSQPSVAKGVSKGSERLISLIVTDGRVSGVGDVVEVAVGTPVRLTVTADVADVLAVEGYGSRAQLTVDEPVQLTFVADEAGEFAVSLESTDTVLTRLRVR